jgi:protein-tyrosine phosphatase
MAQAMLSTHLSARASAVQAVSAGTYGAGHPPPAEVVELMAGWGVDVSGHRGRLVTPADLAAADLILGMTREHVRHAAVLSPGAWPRAFTLREIVDRGRWVGPPRAAEPLADWLARAGHGRTRSDLLGSGGTEDIADPVGGPWQGYQATADLLDGLTSELAGLCWQGLGNAGVFAYRTHSDSSAAAAVPRVTGQHYSAPWVL